MNMILTRATLLCISVIYLTRYGECSSLTTASEDESKTYDSTSIKSSGLGKLVVDSSSTNVEAGLTSFNSIQSIVSKEQTSPKSKKGGASSKSSASKGGNAPACCQICPLRFINQLQLLQLPSEEEQLTYTNFHQFHNDMYTSTTTGSDVEISTLEMIQMNSKHRRTQLQKSGATSSKGGSNALSSMAPCCSLCTSSFLSSNMSPMSAASNIKDSIMNSSKKAGLSSQRSGVSSCCNICSDQFFPPRVYSDVMLEISEGMLSKKKNVQFTNQQKIKSRRGMSKQLSFLEIAESTSGGSCCKTCASSLDPNTKTQEPPPFIEPGNIMQNMEAIARPRNPVNKRKY